MTAPILLLCLQFASEPMCASASPTPDAPMALPDPFLGADGKRIRTRVVWRRQRAALQSLLLREAVGHLPPAPGNVHGKILSSRELLVGKVRYQLVRLSFGPDQSLGFDVALFVPGRPGRFPAIVFPSFDATPGASPLPLLPRPAQQGKGASALELPLGIPDGVGAPPAPVDPAQFAERFAFVFARGYAIATYHYQDTGEDTIARDNDGTWVYRTSRFFPAYPKFDWGLLGAWAWGISRCLDYLGAQGFLDPTRFIVTGHSRVAKAILVAGALDERIALSAPVGSAAAGVGLSRLTGANRGGGEGLDEVVRKYPTWFGPGLPALAVNSDRLPFDQHFWVALTAPRALLALDGEADRLHSAKAVLASLRAALPAYTMTGAKPDRVGLHMAPHGHVLDERDWLALLDFADWQLRGGPAHPEFSLPAETPGK